MFGHLHRLTIRQSLESDAPFPDTQLGFAGIRRHGKDGPHDLHFGCRRTDEHGSPGRLRLGVDRQRPMPQHDALMPTGGEFKHRLASHGHRRAVIESQRQEGRLAFKADHAGTQLVANGEIGKYRVAVAP